MKKQTIVMYKEAVADDDLCVGFECSLHNSGCTHGSYKRSP